jgi:hypothetical protein
LKTINGNQQRSAIIFLSQHVLPFANDGLSLAKINKMLKQFNQELKPDNRIGLNHVEITVELFIYKLEGGEVVQGFCLEDIIRVQDCFMNKRYL